MESEKTIPGVDSLLHVGVLFEDEGSGLTFFETGDTPRKNCCDEGSVLGMREGLLLDYTILCSYSAVCGDVMGVSGCTTV